MLQVIWYGEYGSRPIKPDLGSNPASRMVSGLVRIIGRSLTGLDQ